MFMDVPVMRDIWQATQADRALQELDAEDMACLAGLLSDALRRVAPDAHAPELTAFSQLTMTLIAAAVRQAIALEPKAAKWMLAMFKRLLPTDLSPLLESPSPAAADARQRRKR